MNFEKLRKQNCPDGKALCRGTQDIKGPKQEN